MKDFNPSLSPDRRDLRDPQKLGDFLLTQRDQLNQNFAETGGSPPLSQLYDWFEQRKAFAIPDYPKHDSIGVQAAKDYRAELEARAAEGDRYAASMLAGIPYDEPSD